MLAAWDWDKMARICEINLATPVVSGRQDSCFCGHGVQVPEKIHLKMG